MRGWFAAVRPYAILIAVLLLVPPVFTRVPFFTMGTAVQMGILAIATLGLILLAGYAGQISIGQAAFYGIGAYSSAILTTRAEVSPLLGLAVGAVLCGLVAFAVGSFIFRVRGHYLALATLAFGLMMGNIARQLEITGGGSGIVDIPRLAVGSWIVGGDLRYYYLVATVLVIATVLGRNLVRSLFGRSLQALGDSEIAAASSGVNIARHKRAVFVVAAVLASVAGSLYAHWVTFVDFHTLDLLLSIQLLIMATVGGLRTVWGAPVGAFLVITLSQAAQELLPKLPTNVGGEFEIAVYGLALIAVMLFLPRGVAGGPLAGLSRAESADLGELMREVAADGVTVLLVEHDVHTVMAISDRVVVLDHGTLLADGTAAEVQADPRVRAAYLGEELSA